ncbi:hypothetical protein SELMODRAFT_403990 [Selaginella moellendorffii]|uniref:Uncharacterized protein n=1 Tax=Selaginella moellendorffii TaxID=88036 RepID=D8QT78_SELML|nr:hypothetical protein SELMODRAFT_403990 [Selaginella moellendorffii]
MGNLLQIQGESTTIQNSSIVPVKLLAAKRVWNSLLIEIDLKPGKNVSVHRGYGPLELVVISTGSNEKSRKLLRSSPPLVIELEDLRKSKNIAITGKKNHLRLKMERRTKNLGRRGGAVARDLAERLGPESSRDELVLALNHCASAGDLEQGRQIHAKITQRRLRSSSFLTNHLIKMYGDCGDATSALAVFARLKRRNVFSWNLAIAACGGEDLSMGLYRSMLLEGQLPDNITFVNLIAGRSRSLKEGKAIHEHAVESGSIADVVVATAMVKRSMVKSKRKSQTKQRKQSYGKNDVVMCPFDADHVRRFELDTEYEPRGLPPGVYPCPRCGSYKTRFDHYNNRDGGNFKYGNKKSPMFACKNGCGKRFKVTNRYWEKYGPDGKPTQTSENGGEDLVGTSLPQIGMVLENGGDDFSLPQIGIDDTAVCVSNTQFTQTSMEIDADNGDNGRCMEGTVSYDVEEIDQGTSDMQEITKDDMEEIDQGASTKDGEEGYTSVNDSPIDWDVAGFVRKMQETYEEYVNSGELDPCEELLMPKSCNSPEVVQIFTGASGHRVFCAM